LGNAPSEIRNKTPATYPTNDRNKHVSGDPNPDLRLHGILACAQECFDSQMLLDPFEEQFDLPALTIQIGNPVCRESQGDKVESIERVN
jgi:hypothetical protein